MNDTEVFEVGDKLRYIDIIVRGEGDDLPMDAIERQAVVTEVEDDGTVHVLYGDDLDDWLPSEQVRDLFERVTWDTMM